MILSRLQANLVLFFLFLQSNSSLHKRETKASSNPPPKGPKVKLSKQLHTDISHEKRDTWSKITNQVKVLSPPLLLLREASFGIDVPRGRGGKNSKDLQVSPGQPSIIVREWGRHEYLASHDRHRIRESYKETEGRGAGL